MRINSTDNDLLISKNKEFPPICSREYFMIQIIEEKIEQKGINMLSFDEIFIDHTYSKKERFELISRLIKRKLLKKIKINNKYSEYHCIKTSNPWRIYPKITKKERYDLIKEFK